MVGAQFGPFCYKVGGFGSVGAYERFEGLSGFVDGFSPGCCSFVESVGSDVGCADGLKVGGKFGFGVGQRFAGLVDGLGVGFGLRGDPAHSFERDFLDEGFGLGQVGGGWRVALPGRVPFSASVVDVPALPAGRFDHYVAATGAPDDSGEEAYGLVGSAFGGAVSLLGGLPFSFGDDGGVRVGVYVLPDAKFSQVDAVSQEVSKAAGGHLEPVADYGCGGAVGKVPESVFDKFGVLVGGEASRFGVSDVAFRGLPSLPDSALGCGRPEFFESFAVEVKFVFGDGGEHCSREATCGGGSVDVFVDGDDLTPGFFDAVPRFEKVLGASGGSAQVCDDQAPVAAFFDALYCLVEDRSGCVPAASIEFGSEHFDGFAAGVGPRVYRRGLVFRAAEAIPAAFSDERNSDVAGPGFDPGEDTDYAQSQPETLRDAFAQKGDRCANAR